MLRTPVSNRAPGSHFPSPGKRSHSPTQQCGGFPTRHGFSRKGPYNNFSPRRGMAIKRRENATKFHKTREVIKKGGKTPPPFSRGGRKSRLFPVGISNAPRSSRAPPPTRAGGKQRREEKFVFLTHVFYKTEGQSGGRTKKATPRPAPSRTRGKRTPRRSAARFRRRPRSHSHPFNRKRTSGARSRGVTAVWRPRARHREVRKRGFSKGAFHLLLGRRARDATNAPF